MSLTLTTVDNVATKVNWAWEISTKSKKGLEKLNKVVLEAFKTLGMLFSEIKNLNAYAPVIFHLKAVKAVCEVVELPKKTITLLDTPDLLWKGEVVKPIENHLGWLASTCEIISVCRETGIASFAFLSNISATLGSYPVFGILSGISVNMVKNISVSFLCIISLRKVAVKIYDAYVKQGNEEKNLLNAFTTSCWNRSTFLMVAGDVGRLFLVTLAGPLGALGVFAVSLGIQFVSLSTQLSGWLAFLDESSNNTKKEVNFEKWETAFI